VTDFRLLTDPFWWKMLEESLTDPDDLALGIGRGLQRPVAARVVRPLHVF
jgi:hypothetical protein